MNRTVGVGRYTCVIPEASGAGAVRSRHLHVFVPVEALIWIRSLASVLLIVAHALWHVEMKKVAGEATPSPL